MTLVTGAAGYIGSHVAKQLLLQGKDIVIIDNLSTGFIDTIETLQSIKSFKLRKNIRVRALLSTNN